MANSSAMQRSSLLTFFLSSVVVFWVLLAIGPFIWTVWGSFKVQGDFFSKADWRNAVYGCRDHVRTRDRYRKTSIIEGSLDSARREAARNVPDHRAIVASYIITVHHSRCTSRERSASDTRWRGPGGARYAFWLLMAALIFRADAAYHACFGA